MNLAAPLSRVGWEVYTKAGPLLKRAGVFHPARRLYERVLAGITPKISTVEIAGHEAEFFTESKRETVLFHNGLLAEEAVIADFLSTIHSGDTVFDIGAHLGIYSGFLTRNDPSVSLHCFEPFPENAARLRENLRLNGDNATIHEIAVSDADGRGHLNAWCDEKGHTMASLVEGHEHTVEVETKRGDTIVKELGVIPNVLKIDVEGAERRVIDGFAETLHSPECRTVYCEIHHDRIAASDPAAILEDLKESGFETEWLDVDSVTDVRILKATRPEA